MNVKLTLLSFHEFNYILKKEILPLSGAANVQQHDGQVLPHYQIFLTTSALTPSWKTEVDLQPAG